RKSTAGSTANDRNSEMATMSRKPWSWIRIDRPNWYAATDTATATIARQNQRGSARPCPMCKTSCGTSTSGSAAGSVDPSGGRPAVRSVTRPRLAPAPCLFADRSAGTEHHQPLLGAARLEHHVAGPGVAHQVRGLDRVLVAREQQGVVGHSGEGAGQRVVQRLGVAAGQVGTAAPIEEERVAGHQAVVDVEALA